MRLQNILFFDGFYKENVDDCEMFRHPYAHKSEKYGLVLDEEVWARTCIGRINKEYEEIKKKNGE